MTDHKYLDEDDILLGTIDFRFIHLNSGTRFYRSKLNHYLPKNDSSSLPREYKGSGVIVGNMGTINEFGSCIIETEDIDLREPTSKTMRWFESYSRTLLTKENLNRSQLLRTCLHSIRRQMIFEIQTEVNVERLISDHTSLCKFLFTKNDAIGLNIEPLLKQYIDV